MRKFKIKNVEHLVYDELPDGLVIHDDWRTAKEGDWVKTDDGYYIQILKVKVIGTTKAVMTCIGTYPVNGRLDTVKRSSRYTLNGKSPHELLLNRVKPTGREVLFAQRVALGDKPLDAYLEVFDATSRQYAASRAAMLIKTKRIKKLMRAELKDVFEVLDIDLEYLISKAKDELETSKNGSDRNTALKMLWDAYGVIESQSQTESIGVFQGFVPQQINEIERPKLETGSDD